MSGRLQDLPPRARFGHAVADLCDEAVARYSAPLDEVSKRTYVSVFRRDHLIAFATSSGLGNDFYHDGPLAGAAAFSIDEVRAPRTDRPRPIDCQLPNQRPARLMVVHLLPSQVPHASKVDRAVAAFASRYHVLAIPDSPPVMYSVMTKIVHEARAGIASMAEPDVPEMLLRNAGQQAVHMVSDPECERLLSGLAVSLETDVSFPLAS